MFKRFIKDLLKIKLTNINKTAHLKRALICYTTKPFTSGKGFKHTNNQESKIIVDVLDELGFDVDVVDYDYNGAIAYQNYDLIFGFGNVYQNSFFTNKNQVRIFYATGAYSYYQNIAEAKRVIEFNTRKHVNFSPKRLIPWDWSISMELSDSLIVIGNAWTKSTYLDNLLRKNKIYSINATALRHEHSLARRKSSTHYLWLGSTGLIHKGLDLCLEFFSVNPNLTLHICGPIEKDFMAVYEKELKLSNIFFHGFVNIQSEKFREIVNECSFSLMPTCSEGQSTALLTSMAYGLVPIASRESGVDVEDIGGVLIESLSQKSLSKAIDISLRIPIETLMEKRSKIIQYISNTHDTESFKRNISQLVSKIFLEA